MYTVFVAKPEYCMCYWKMKGLRVWYIIFVHCSETSVLEIILL